MLIAPVRVQRIILVKRDTITPEVNVLCVLVFVIMKLVYKMVQLLVKQDIIERANLRVLLVVMGLQAMVSFVLVVLVIIVTAMVDARNVHQVQHLVMQRDLLVRVAIIKHGVLVNLVMEVRFLQMENLVLLVLEIISYLVDFRVLLAVRVQQQMQTIQDVFVRVMQLDGINFTTTVVRQEQRLLVIFAENRMGLV